LSRHYGGLYGDFRKFFPELLAFSEVRSARPTGSSSLTPASRTIPEVYL
jgi:hypothetical protein